MHINVLVITRKNNCLPFMFFFFVNIFVTWSIIGILLYVYEINWTRIKLILVNVNIIYYFKIVFNHLNLFVNKVFIIICTKLNFYDYSKVFKTIQIFINIYFIFYFYLCILYKFLNGSNPFTGSEYNIVAGLFQIG